MRVMHVIGAFCAGGAERLAVKLAPELVSRGMQIELFALSNRHDDVGAAMMVDLDGWRIRYSSGPTLRVRVGAVVALARALRSLQPDIIHMHTPNTELAVALARYGYHGAPLALVRTIHSTRQKVAEGAAYRWAYRRNKVAVSIACSEAVAATNAGIGGRIEVIANGVRFDWSLQAETARQQARQRLGLNPHGTHFLAVGRMSGDSPSQAPKAHDTLILAWQAAYEGMGGSQLHLVGDGNLRPQLERLSNGDASIRFWGVQGNIADWLLAADVFVMPSRFEGLPMAGIEAVGTGLPCIFSDIPPLRQLEPPVASWVAVDDVEALAQSFLAWATGAPRVSPATAAAVRSRFDIATTADRYVQIYRQLIGGAH